MDLHKIKGHLVAFLGHAVGGPVRYTGSTMRRAHGHLHIEQWHFDRFARHLAETLREDALPEKMIAAVMKRVWPLANQIVNSGTLSAAAD
jgi:hemoglobin